MTGQLHHLAIPVADDGSLTASGSVSFCHPALADLLRVGIGALRDGETGHLIAHRSVDLCASVALLGQATVASVLAGLPSGALLVTASAEQSRHLRHSETEGQTVWNVQQTFELFRSCDGIDSARLDLALAALTERQDVLRTNFRLCGDGWVQVIASPAIAGPPPRVVWLDLPTPDAFMRFVAARRAERIDLAQGCLFRVWASRIGARWYLGFVAHHALADAFTLPLLFTQLMAAHDVSADPAASLPRVVEQYWQYTLAEFGKDASRQEAAKRFWGECLKDAGTMRLLAAKGPHTAAGNAISLSFARVLPPRLVTDLARLHSAHGITYSQLLTAALAFLVIHGLGNAKAALRMFHNRRDRAGLLGTMGDFSNLLVVPYELPLSETVTLALNRTRERSLSAVRHALPFADLLDIAGGASGEVLFDSADLDASGVMADHARSLFAEGLLHPETSAVGVEGEAIADLFFQAVKVGGGITLVCSWRKSMFDRTWAANFTDLLIAVAERMIAEPDTTVGALVHSLDARLSTLRPPTKPTFFVECQRLNQVDATTSGGKMPVFWVHGAFGDASVYLPLAQRLDYPVYGIQARGLFDPQPPLAGVGPIATFYREMIQAIQPRGPYDLGGYSIGGTFAYEIARQLQQAGEEVASLTLVDALFPPEHKRIGVDRYDHLHFVAMGLIGVSMRRDPSWSPSALAGLTRPGREERDPDILLDGFVRFCLNAGVARSETWLRGYMQRMTAIQNAYGVEVYRPLPLPRSIPHVRYLKNRRGLFYGERSAYMNSRPEDPLRAVDYWSAWQTLLPKLRLEQFDVDNHIDMLADEAVLAALSGSEPAIGQAEPLGPGPAVSVGAAAAYLRDQIADIIGRPLDNLGVDDPLDRSGMDSLIATELTQRLQSRLGGAFSIATLFQHNTLGDLAAHLLAEHAQALSGLIGAAAVAAEPRILAVAPQPDMPGATAASEQPKPATSARRGHAIAIIGVSGRYPKAPNLDAFWQVLRDGVDCITEVPADRWDWRAYYDTDRTRDGAHYSKWGGFIDDVDRFDPLFFNISPREAAVTDPQERLFLQQVWAALEDAGYRREDLRGIPGDPRGAAVSVYAGVMYGEYQFLGVEESLKGAGQALGGSYASIANRVSYVLDLHGPCMAVDTACSSSLTAIHMACRDLREGVSDLAIAGGVSLSLHPNKYTLLSAGQFISGSGHCESFGEGGEGFIPAEGVGVVILKRLEDAERDGDNIHAVIRGSAINHGGRTNGYTVPNPAAQQRAISGALLDAGIEPGWVSYVEAHGTGTRIGDPIEIAGLSQAFGLSDNADGHPCWIGSAKSNLGHCEAAAGVAGLTKVLLQMRHGKIAPSLHSAKLNSHIDFARTPFRVNQELRDWDRPVVDGQTRPRIAGISSFGAGGANAHMLVEEYRASPDPAAVGTGLEPVAIILSARTSETLRAQVENLLAWLDAMPKGAAPPLRQIAYMLQMGREPMAERLGMVVGTMAQMRDGLAAFLESAPGDTDVRRGRLGGDAPYRRLFPEEGELREMILTWLSRGQLDRVIELWLQGAPVDWMPLYASRQPRRISLPTYPFLRERHWIDRKHGHVSVQTGEAATLRPTGNLLMAAPEWREKALPAFAAPFDGRRIVFACGIGTEIPGATGLKTTETGEGERFADIAAGLFDQLRPIVTARNSGGLLVQFLVPSHEPLLVALGGQLRALRHEYPAITGQIIVADIGQPAEVLADMLERNGRAPEDFCVLYRDGQRMVRSWRELPSFGPESLPDWRPGGVWLITGGLGGLGLIFARDIARTGLGSTLVLVGRSRLGAAGAAAIRDLEASGARVVYRRADVARRDQVDALIASLRSEGCVPTGVIHAAGIISDNFLVRKSREEFLKVLAPKVQGTVNIDQASRHLPLDVFLLFSSAAGAFGNVGQTDYATANAFMDAYAERRSVLVAKGKASGRTISVAWPLWRDGGMAVRAASLEAIEQVSGMVPMETANGIAALARMLVMDGGNFLVAQGDTSRLREWLRDESPRRTPEQPNRGDGSDAPGSALAGLRALFGEMIHLSPERVDVLEPLENYGIDSVLITKLNGRLEEIFGGVPKTLFFEYRRLKDIADYLVREFPEACARWTDNAGTKLAPSPAVGVPIPAEVLPFAAAPPSALRPAMAADEPIAIIGLSGHYGSAETLDEFWSALRDGRNLVGEIPPERWSLDGFFEPDMRKAVETGKSYGKWGSFLPAIDQFDPFFFNISPREARAMDPQERWLLTSAWEALEDAGYTRAMLAKRHGGRVGVFAGITNTGFDLYGPDLWRRGETIIPRTSFASMANRISYVLDINGPSLAIDTMCSSSLTAVHEACEQIRRGACEVAIAGGVNLYVHPASYRNLSSNRMLSVDGRCASFGKDGNGFVPGEGVGAVLLKPLSRARADGDRIQAVIRGSHVNHGGRTSGYTVPNPVAQADLIREALRRAGTDARLVSYFEAHGTGTALGDPVEINGMTRAFRADTADCGFCAIGSVKSNIGHLEAAAGLAGLTKVILQMRHGTLVPTLHARETNPNIDFAATPFFPQQVLAPWPTGQSGGTLANGPRVACVSSFGAGGTNAHVVVQEYREPADANAPATGPFPIVLSARTAERLLEVARRLERFLSRPGEPEPALVDVAFTLENGREAMEHRLALVAPTVAALADALRGFLAGRMDGIWQGEVTSNKDAVEALSNDPAAASRVVAWMGAGIFSPVLDLWVKGYPVAFDAVWATAGAHISRAPKRIALPTYPFAPERYWFDQDAPAAEWDGLSWVPVWEHRNAAAAEAERLSGAVLVVHDASTGDFVQALSQRIVREFPEAIVATVTGGELDAAGVTALLDRIGPVRRFYFVAGGMGETTRPENLLHDWQSNALPLLRLARELLRTAVRDNAIDGFIVGFDAGNQALGGGLDGLGYAIAQSDHHFHIRNILLSRTEAADESALDSLLDLIQVEPRAARGETVRLRRAGRQVRTFLPLIWPAGDTKGGFVRGGTYLILGGAGMVGRAVTRLMVDRYQARVIWIGRRPSAEIGSLLVDYPDPASRPFYFQADALDPASLAAGLAAIATRFGRLDGAVFAGKIFSLNDTLERADEALFHDTAAIKTQGILNFVQALRDAPPGFLCVFSSAQAFPFLPAHESVSYAAAITAADRLTRKLAADAPFPVGIVNWGYWASSVADTPVAEGLSRHFSFISDEAGFRFLERFIRGLRLGILDQVLCAGVRDSIERMMGRHPDHQISLAAPVAEFDTRFEPPPAQSPRRRVAGRELRSGLDRWVARLLHTQMRRTPRDTVQPKYQRLLGEFDAIPDPGWSGGEPWAAWTAYRAGLILPELQAAADLAENCLRALPDILGGKVAATDVLFPAGSLRKVEALYRGNGLSDHFNDHLAGAVATFVAAHPGQVRILEIGAGTGSTTAMVVERIRPYLAKIAEYRVTDLSKAFLIQAEQRFGSGFPAMTYGLLDIQHPLARQGTDPGTYDVIIATNVFHATRNIRETLRNAHAALKRGGIVLVNEILEKSVVGSTTFGLLDGWWLFDDERLRIPGSPLLDLQGWLTAMEEVGFTAIRTLAGGAGEFGQDVILGVSNGLIRQPRAGTPVPAAARPGRVTPTQPLPDPIAPRPTSPRPVAQAGAAADLDGILRDALVETLGGGHARIRQDVPFAELGVDSILGVGFIERINAQLGLDLNATLLFERTCLDQLAGFIREHHADAMRPAAAGNGTPVAARAAVPASPDAIAVVGLSGRFPGAADIDAFWRVLISGRTVVGELPAPFQGYRWGALLSDRDGFDPLFFNISPREAESMNRHQRLIMLEGWRALEHAGYNPKALAESRTGIFVGAEPSGDGGESFTGASDAIVASRLSYVLGLRGPALVVNTGCSSSGVALHLACQSLRHGETDMALAAGAAVSMDPDVLTALAATGMLSPSGRCLSFDHRADGTVLSEGVGVVVLKRLADAVASGDTIHGVIVASGTNQDGASNGITAPNGSAQEALILETYRRFGIDPSAISYIETHGTGTALGDPIEANALKRAFATLSDEARRRGIGSAKAHIGHTSAASGVIGLIKLLLSMRHQMLPALPGFERLNPRIDFTGTSFGIQAEAAAWNQDQAATAALSSFGHSGTNAHFVVRGWPAGAVAASPAAGVLLYPLSARDPAGLRRVAINLKVHLKAYPELAARDVADTLKHGREAMEVRVVFAAAGLDSLVAQLDNFANGREAGTVAEPMASRWLAGQAIAWPSDTGLAPKRVPLPAYPFLTEPYVIHSGSRPGNVAPWLHPLVQRNVSDLDGVRFASRLTGSEFFLMDHKVHGRAVLPGVAYLEMARAAVEQAVGRSPSRLEDVTWERPLEVVAAPIDVQIGLSRDKEGRIAYVIHSEGPDCVRLFHGSGVASLGAPVTDATHLDLEAAVAATAPLPGIERACADAFAAMGVLHGPGFQALRQIRVGKGLVLAVLALPEGTGSDAFILHPSLMDCALQAAMALTLQASEGAFPAEPSLPFAVERIDLLAPLPAVVHALVRRASGDSVVEKLDLDLCDGDGRVLVRIRGFSSRRLALQPAAGDAPRIETGTVALNDAAGEPAGITLLAPVWNVAPAFADHPEPTSETAVLVVGGSAEQHATIRLRYPNARHLPLPASAGEVSEFRLSTRFGHVVWIAPEVDEMSAETVMAASDHGLMQLFRLVKGLLGAGYGLEELGWTLATFRARGVASGEAVHPAQALIHGLAGSMAKEFPHWRVRLVDMEASDAWPVDEIFRAPSHPDGDALVRRGGIWFSEALASVSDLPNAPVPYRKGGVYLIIGGAGGVGAVWSRAMIERHGARIVWIGRRRLDDEIRQRIASLATLGPAPVYVQCDAADYDGLLAVRDYVKRDFGRIDGIVHSAIVLRDRGLAGMSEADFRAGLAPKLGVSINIARVFSGEALDFVLFFSSLQTFTKAAGQSNYAAGSAFIDCFAEWLDQRWHCPVKVANWGYWGDTGIVADAEHRDRMARSGLGSIEPRDGMSGLDRLMAGSLDRLALVRFLAPPADSDALCGGERLRVYPPSIPGGLEMFET